MINLCNVLNSSSSVRVHAHWEPIADATFNMHNDSLQLAEMFDLSPYYSFKEYETEDFKVFLLGTALMEVLHIYGTSSTDTPDDAVVKIDTTAFECGGLLHIEIQVGVGKSAGTFELFHVDTELPSKEGDDAALDGAWNVSPGSIGHISFTISVEISTSNWSLRVPTLKKPMLFWHVFLLFCILRTYTKLRISLMKRYTGTVRFIRKV